MLLLTINKLILIAVTKMFQFFVQLSKGSFQAAAIFPKQQKVTSDTTSIVGIATLKIKIVNASLRFMVSFSWFLLLISF